MIQNTNLLTQYVNKPQGLKNQNQQPQINSAAQADKNRGYMISAYLQNLAAINKPAVTKPTSVQQPEAPKKIVYRNNLRSMFRHEQANILAIIPRTFNAKDTNGNEYIDGNEQGGTFINAIERLDEVKEDGFNTLHLLPISTPGKLKAMGTAGSVYSPKDLIEIDPKLYDPSAPGTVKDQFKKFIDECHKPELPCGK